MAAPFIRKIRTGEYLVSAGGRVLLRTRDLTDAVECADVDGTGIVACDAKTEADINALCDAPCAF